MKKAKDALIAQHSKKTSYPIIIKQIVKVLITATPRSSKSVGVGRAAQKDTGKRFQIQSKALYCTKISITNT